jgi:hypothetical protein
MCTLHEELYLFPSPELTVGESIASQVRMQPNWKILHNYTNTQLAWLQAPRPCK